MPHPNKAHQNKSTLTFEEWESMLSDICEDYFSLPLADMDDVLTRDAYDDGLTPAQAFDKFWPSDENPLDDYEPMYYYQEFDEYSDADPGL